VRLSLAPALCDFFPLANPAAAYRHRSAQLISAFGIGPSVRISQRTGESLSFSGGVWVQNWVQTISWVVSPSLTPRVLRIFPCGLALRVRRAVRRMLPRPPVFFWLTRLSFPSLACVYFWLGKRQYSGSSVRCGCFGKSGPLGRMLSPVVTGN